MSLLAWIILGTVAVINVVLISAYILFGRRQTVVDQRLGQITQAGGRAAAAPAASRGGPSPLSLAISRLLAGRGFADTMAKNLAQADMKINVAEYLALHILLAVGAYGVGWLLFGRSVVFGVLVAIGSLFVPRAIVKFQQKKRLRLFDSQLSDMLNLVVNGLRAGYSPMQAMEAVGREMPAPISVEFHRVVQEIQLGLPQEAALENLLRRVPSADLDFVITAMNVQREVGGNLAEILDNISHTIRERVRIKGEIASLTAQGQITAWVISGLPIGLALLLFLINRSYMMNMFGPPMVFGLPICGISMLLTGLVMIVTGFLIVQKIVDIEI